MESDASQPIDLARFSRDHGQVHWPPIGEAEREPQPSDGPEFHADHAAWERRVTTEGLPAPSGGPVTIDAATVLWHDVQGLQSGYQQILASTDANIERITNEMTAAEDPMRYVVELARAMTARDIYRLLISRLAEILA